MTLRRIDPICEALSLGSQLLESMQQIANTLDSICDAQSSHIQATDELAEAVRALKPAPMLRVVSVCPDCNHDTHDHDIVEGSAHCRYCGHGVDVDEDGGRAIESGPGGADVERPQTPTPKIFTVNDFPRASGVEQLDVELVSLKEQLATAMDRMAKAEHRLLDYEGKEMPYSGRTRLAQAEAEVERLQQVSGAQALTIDVLKDDLARWRDLSAEAANEKNAANAHAEQLRAEAERLARLTLDLKANFSRQAKVNGELAEENERLRGVPGVGEAMAAELKRFREREEKVAELLAQWAFEVTYNQDLAHRYSFFDKTIAAVRDFKAST